MTRRSTRRPAPENDPLRDLRDASRGERLHKALADAGVGSRRACEQLIAEHRVSVNGVTVKTMPIWVDLEKDRIEVDGRPVGRRAKRGHTYLMVNKTRGVICTNDDPEGRTKITDLIPHPQRLFCVGRLDGQSTGLVLLTDDGELTHHLTHPRYGVAKTYEVTVQGVVSEQDIGRLAKSIGKAAEARAAHPPAVQVIDREADHTKLRITLREDRNRDIRTTLARLGFKVRRLKRVAVGPLQLKGVAPGGWRDLTRQEVSALRKSAGRDEPARKTAHPKTSR